MKVTISNFHELRDLINSTDHALCTTPANQEVKAGTCDAMDLSVSADVLDGGCDLFVSKPCYLMRNPEDIIADAGY